MSSDSRLNLLNQLFLEKMVADTHLQCNKEWLLDELRSKTYTLPTLIQRANGGTSTRQETI